MARAGFGSAVITPPLGVELCGYGVYLQRQSTTVHDDLFVRALLLDDDTGERVLLLTLDLVGLSQELSETIASGVGTATGLPAGRVLVSCTHTHSGPATAFLNGWGVVDSAYIDSIPGRCVEAAIAASRALIPIRVGLGHSTVSALGFNRVRPGGPLDPGLHVLRIDDMQGQPLGVLFSHGCHPVTIDRRTPAGTAISADWPGQVARRLREVGYGEAFFRLGPCGDVDPVVAWHEFGFEGMNLSAELVTQALLAVLQSLEMTDSLRLTVVRNTVSLPLQPLTEHDISVTIEQVQRQYGSVHVTDDSQDAAWQQFYQTWAHRMRASLATQPDHLPVPLVALFVNGEAWLHLPGEIFTGLSDRIRARSPVPVTVVTTLAAHFIGYLPDHEDFAAGGYASVLTPRILQMPPYSPQVGDVLVDGAVHLLNSVEG